MLDGREKESKGGIFTPLILNHLNIPPSQKNWTPLKLMKRYDMIRHGFPGRWGPRGTTTQEEKRPEAGRIMRLLHPCSQEPAKPWFQRRKREGKTQISGIVWKWGYLPYFECLLCARHFVKSSHLMSTTSITDFTCQPRPAFTNEETKAQSDLSRVTQWNEW